MTQTYLPELDRRVRAAHRCVAMFQDRLMPAQWADCVAGRDDPDSFCDSNMVVDAACESIFGRNPAQARFKRERKTGQDETPGMAEDLWLARMNAIVRLTTRLMLGDQLTADQQRALVADDDSHGLALVGGGRRLRAVIAEFGMGKGDADGR
jgi:hypothetical protein